MVIHTKTMHEYLEHNTYPFFKKGEGGAILRAVVLFFIQIL